MTVTSRRLLVLVVLLLSTITAVAADPPRAGRNSFVIRGQAQDVYFLPGAGSGPHRKLIYAPGEGGWRGFGVTIAERLAGAGYDVLGLDTRRYLQSFSASTLTPKDIASDWRTLAGWIRGEREKVLVVGWSEGAGLALAAAADPGSREVLNGLISIGLTERNILAWRWSDLMAEMRKTLPNEPTFASADYIGNVAPLPFFMIASVKDEYISLDATNKLYAKANDPKRLNVIAASDHKFTGKTEEFFRSLIEGAAWIWSAGHE